MIVGIGTDLVDIRRIEKAVLRFGSLFCDRIFTPAERELCESRNRRKMAAYALRFAAKEAFSKAVGTGIGKNVFFQDVETLSLKTGKPVLTVSGATERFLLTLVPQGKVCRIDVSLSDEYPYASAFVVVSAD